MICPSCTSNFNLLICFWTDLCMRHPTAVEGFPQDYPCHRAPRENNYSSLYVLSLLSMLLMWSCRVGVGLTFENRSVSSEHLGPGVLSFRILCGLAADDGFSTPKTATVDETAHIHTERACSECKYTCNQRKLVLKVCVHFPADFTKDCAVKRCFRHVRANNPPIDSLICPALLSMVLLIPLYLLKMSWKTRRFASTPAAISSMRCTCKLFLFLRPSKKASAYKRNARHRTRDFLTFAYIYPCCIASSAAYAPNTDELSLEVFANTHGLFVLLGSCAS